MTLIRSRQIISREIKEIICEDDPENPVEFPKIFYFCESIGRSTYKITIEKVSSDIYIDADGNKWIKQNE